MRIVTWNCNGGFARKVQLAMSLQPDLLVLQEASFRHCEEAALGPFLWTGRGHRGLAVISCTGLPLTLDPAFDSELTHFLPVHVGELRLLAVWRSVLTSTARYVRLIHRALDHYADFVNHRPGILIGDLNSSTVFDAKHRQLNHTMLVERLGLLDYTSAWHRQTGEAHGEESQPTFYMYRRPERTWHLDYAFLTQNLISGARIEIGAPETWLPWSDHLPVVIDIPATDSPPG